MAELDATKTLQAIQGVVLGCREEGPNGEKCFQSAEYVLWGKLIPREGLGPRCYVHASHHVSHSALAPNSGYALIDLCGLVEAIHGAYREENQK